ncbi:MAG: hypothetical protein ACTSRZ_08340 [Promethearchaeota archaeon]
MRKLSKQMVFAIIFFITFIVLSLFGIQSLIQNIIKNIDYSSLQTLFGISLLISLILINIIIFGFYATYKSAEPSLEIKFDKNNLLNQLEKFNLMIDKIYDYYIEKPIKEMKKNIKIIQKQLRKKNYEEQENNLFRKINQLQNDIHQKEIIKDELSKNIMQLVIRPVDIKYSIIPKTTTKGTLKFKIFINYIKPFKIKDTITINLKAIVQQYKIISVKSLCFNKDSNNSDSNNNTKQFHQNFTIQNGKLIIKNIEDITIPSNEFIFPSKFGFFEIEIEYSLKNRESYPNQTLFDYTLTFEQTDFIDYIKDIAIGYN